MTLNELRDYNKWINKKPTLIRKAVIDIGGWAKVFPPTGVKAVPVKVDIPIPQRVIPPGLRVGGKISENIPGLLKAEWEGFPLWASRVRNYFNWTPVTLKLLPPLDGMSRTNEHRGAVAMLPREVQKIVFSLNGDVYVDEHNRPWLNMTKLGAVYHVPGEVDFGKIRDAIAAELYEIPYPVFKLISPDGTGGSMEVCLHNTKLAKTIGRVGEVVNVSPVLVREEIYRGSYNYAETIQRGLAEHDFSDIKPHQEYAGFYINPPFYSAIGDRKFPPILSTFDPFKRQWK